MEEVAHQLAYNVKRIRIEKGFSQQSLARKIGSDKSYVSRIESGAKNVTLSTLIKISQALEVSIPQLFK